MAEIHSKKDSNTTPLHEFSEEDSFMNDEMVQKTPEGVTKRENWSRSVDFLVACVGGSVGLGNVWRFPYLCYKNGGGAFLIPYFVTMCLASLPLFILEVSLGQYMSAGAIRAWSIVPLFQGLGMTITAIVFYINCYYNVILAWAFMYFFHSFASHLPWDSCDGSWNSPECTTNFTKAVTTTNISSITSNTSSLPLVDPVTEFWENKVLGLSSGIDNMGTVKWDLALCLLLAWVVIYLCICKGIKSSGKVMYFTAPAPYVFMIIILIRNATLEGSAEGVQYYLRPNLTKLGEMSVWTDAGKQTFFSLCISLSIVLTLGSYNKFKHNCCRDSVITALINAFTSLFAGFLVFTILGFMAHQQGRPIHEVAESGPGLVFIAYPKAVAQMPLSQFWSAVFFLMIILIGLDSQFLGVEALITAIVDQFPNLLRRKYRKEVFIGLVCLAMFLFGLPFIHNGGMYVFYLVDFYSGGRILMLMGFLEVVAIAYVYGRHRFLDNMTMMVGRKWMRWMSPYLTVCWTVFTPLICMTMFILSAVYDKQLTYGRPNGTTYYYPLWADIIGWIITVSVVIWIPGLVVYRFVKHGFSLKVFRLMLVPYSLKSHQMRPQDKTERTLRDLETDMSPLSA